MSFNDKVLEALPESGGITYPDLIKMLDRSKSQIGTALRELEAAGKVKRERIQKPSAKRIGRMDWGRSPKVIWRRVG
jgi:predicted transcriptional regulator